MKQLKSNRIDARATDKTIEMLNKCCRHFDVSQSDAIRIAITMLYDSIKENNGTSDVLKIKEEDEQMDKEKLDNSLMLRISSSEKEKIRQFCQENNTTLLKLIRLGMEYMSKQK